MNWVLIGLVLAAIVIAKVYWRNGGAARTSLPSPNAYDHYATIGESIGRTPNAETASEEELAQFVQNQADVLEQIRAGLQFESCVPIEYDSEFLAKDIDRYSSIRQAARFLLADARLAEAQDRTGDAADIYLEVVHLSRQMSHGGLLVHLMMTAAYEGNAWTAIEQLVPSMTSDEKADFLARLELLPYPRDSMQEVLVREQTLGDATRGFWRMLMARNTLRQMLVKQIDGTS